MTKYLKLFLFVSFLSFKTISAVAQACVCPPSSTCKACSGGYTSLTLRYNGPATGLILIKDGANIVVDLTISPSQEFTLKGSKKNEKFAEKNVQVVLNGLPNTILGSSCSDLSVGFTYGNFTVVAAESINGSIVCCTSPPPDIVPPLITNVSGPIQLDVANGCSAQALWPEPTASDNCILKSFTSSHTSGQLFPIGTTTVVYTATDEAGLISTASFTVTVSDRKAPVFTGGPVQDIVMNSSESCSAIVSWTEPQVTDECSVIISQSHKPNSTFNLGTTKVQYEAKDASGNTSFFTFNILIEDSRSIEILNCPNDIQRSAERGPLTHVSWIAPATTGSCEPIMLESNHKPNDLFPIGTTTVEYLASTPSGKKAHCSFKVTVQETQLKISNLITPDGDGLNDHWVVANIENFRDNQVVIFDRWGGVIFQAARYDNESVVWRGTNKSGGSVPTGTYFYTIVAHRGEEKIHASGAVELVR